GGRRGPLRITMYPHQTERLNGVLEAFGVDALVATSPADVAYLTGFWSLSHAVFDAEILAVYSKAGTALVIPTIDAPAFAAGDAAADHVACHGRFHVNLAERADEHARRAARLATEPADTAADGLARVLDALGLGQARVGLDDAGLLRPAAGAIAARFAGRRVTPAVGAVARARAVKSPYEIDCLAQALRIAEESIHAVLGELKPGTTGVEGGAVFEAAVTAVRAAGLPEFRRHHVGHGIGLEPAEAPWLRPGGDTLEAGMVLRVETPYYELGGFGVNVKETVLVTRGGATVVNRSHRGLVLLD